MTAAAAAPALACPPWCGIDHERDARLSHHHQVHRNIGEHAGWVTLLLVDYGDSVLKDSNGELNIHLNWGHVSGDVKTVVRPLAEADQFAELAEAFGRPDVAALIRELAALAAEDGAK